MTGTGRRTSPRQLKAAVSPRRRVRTGPVSDEEAAERRARVLAVAGEEFLNNGYRGASLDVVAQRSQVSKATLYREFGAKEDLFQAFIMANIQGYSMDIAEAINSGSTPRDVLCRIVERSRKGMVDERNLAILTLAIAERGRFPNLASMLLEEWARVREPIARYLLSIGKGLNAAEADRRAFHLMNMAVGGFSPLLTGGWSRKEDETRWAESVVEVFLSAFPLKTGRKAAR